MRVGLIGYGIMGGLHHLACQQHPTAELVAVANRSEGKLAGAREKGVKGLYTDFRAMLAREKLDLAIISLPDRNHLDAVVESLGAGCHVLVEKPMAVNLGDAGKMAEAARKSGRKLAANFSFRMDADFQDLGRTMRAGKLGKTKYLHIRINNRIDVPTTMISWGGESSPTEFLMPHSIDLARWFTGEEIVEVRAQSTDGVLKGRGVDTHDVMCVTARMSKGTMLFLESSWILPQSFPNAVDFLVDVHGSEAGARLDRNETGISVYTETHQRPINWLSVLDSGRGVGFFFESVASFLDWYDGRADEAHCNLNDALRNTAALEAILKSARSGGAGTTPGDTNP